MIALGRTDVGSTGRIDVLDGWRAISVMLVVVSHLVSNSSLKIYFGEMFRGILASYGLIGVQFFFVISGFVICSGLLREEGSTGRISIAGFYIRRVARIVPLLAIYLLTLALLTRLNLVEVPASSLLIAAAFACNLPDTVTGGCDWYVAHTWSLAYEEQFYLAFPFLFVVVGGGRIRLLTGCVLAFAAALLLLYWIRAPSVAPLRHIFALGCGVVCALHRERVFAVLSRVPAFVIVAFALVPFVVQLMPWSSRLTWFIFLVCVGPAIAFGMLGCVVKPSLQFLAARPLTAVGRASYGIYLWQQIFTGEHFASRLAVYASGIILMSVIVAGLYHYVELPLIGFGRKIAARSSVRQQVGSALRP